MYLPLEFLLRLSVKQPPRRRSFPAGVAELRFANDLPAFICLSNAQTLKFGEERRKTSNRSIKNALC